MDLWFTEPKNKTIHNCTICRKNPQVAKQRKCDDPGFDNIRHRKVDSESIALPFCAGKATWYPEITELFEQCRVSLETGILPEEGGLNDQSSLFVECFPVFIERWRERQYGRMWRDIGSFTKNVLESLFPKKRR